ncbi:MAG: FAD-dependent oxidoreductase [Salinarimonadaceae bacterium]|nr:MAG: FAD-dependent oxidoreductase [Salinarimonadaceae bacterium]
MRQADRKADILVIGAGPAGLNAALAAASAGASVLVLDENASAGGQYFRQPIGLEDKSGGEPGRGAQTSAEKGRDLIARAKAAGIRIAAHSTVIARTGEHALAFVESGADGESIVEARAAAIILATGAHDRAIAFPGWDLPGVLTPGGVQTLVKSSGARLKGPVILAGSGPFLMPVARSLLEAGTNLTAVHELARPSRWLARAGRMVGHGERLAELAGYAAYFVRQRLSGARLDWRFGSRVVRAEGEGRLERVVVARCDAHGSPQPGTESVREAAFLAVGYGFVASVQSAALLGCRLLHRENAGGFVVAHDEDMFTGTPGVFAAGEVAGIGGIACAAIEGRLAGLCAARSIGFAVDERAIVAARKERRKRRAFAALVAELYPVPRSLYDAIPDDVVVCRCEEVSAGAIRAACAPWIGDASSLKAATRCGMGRCQGRFCGHQLQEILARENGVPVEDIGPMSMRPPIKPVAARLLAAWGERREPVGAASSAAQGVGGPDSAGP